MTWSPLDRTEIGHAEQIGRMRPDHGEGFADVRCSNCGATWVGVVDDECTWCAKGVEPTNDTPEEARKIQAEWDAAAKRHAADDDAKRRADSSFQPLDLGPVLDGNYTQPEPTILRRDDRQALYYAGQVNGVHGDSGTGKGFVVLYAIKQQIASGRNVMLIDTEDVPGSIVARLRLLGATDTAIREHLIYIRPTEAFGIMAVERLIEIVGEHNVSLVVIDSLGECFGLDGIDENHDAEVGPWLRKVARRLADAGPAVVLVDHSTKANDNPLHPSGSKRKHAAIGGASYLVTATKPLAAGTGGRLRLTCAKDRHGTYAHGEHVADFVMHTDLAGTHVELYAPNPIEVDETLPMVLAAHAAVTAVKNEGAPMSLRMLRQAMKIKASNDVRTAGIELAVARGALDETSGPRKSRVFGYLKELPESGKP